jgi:NADH dehydrogenase
VLFGTEDILINNIAWALRTLPVFGIYEDGRYRLQPIYVDDLAAAAVDRVEALNRLIVLAGFHLRAMSGKLACRGSDRRTSNRRT